MDICAIDWRAVTPLLASIIAAGTALYISNRWSKQKGSEVVALEAKEIIYKIKDVGQFFEINKNTLDNNNCVEIIEKYEDLCSELVHKIDFMYRSIENKNDKRVLAEFVIALQMDTMFHKEKIINKSKTKEQINNIFNKMGDNFHKNRESIVLVHMNYALYKSRVR